MISEDDAARRKRISVRARRMVYEGRCTVEEITVDQARSDGGQQTIVREVVRYGRNVVAILPVDRRRKCLLLCRQLRVPVMADQDDPFPWEVCAGRLEEGEDVLDGARRELMEEFGVEAQALKLACSSYSSPGILGSRVDHFLCDYSGTERQRGGGLVEEGEDITVHEMTCSEAATLWRQGAIRDAKALILLQHLMLTEPELFSGAD